MTVHQATDSKDPRINALITAVNLEELDSTPFLDYLKRQVEYYTLDKGLDYPDLESEEIWVDANYEFTLCHQNGKYCVFEGLETEEGAVELFKIFVEIEGTAGDEPGIVIQRSSSEGNGITNPVVSVVVSLEAPTEEQKADFSAKLLEVVRTGARVALAMSI